MSSHDDQLQVYSAALKVPVTALCFLTNELVVAGIGPYIQIYNIRTEQCIERHRVFTWDRVHGVELAPESVGKHYHLAVFGGKSLQLWRVHLPSDHHPPTSAVLTPWGPVRQVRDWIMACHWVYPENSVVPLELALALGHNQVEVYQLDSWALVHHIQCAVQCIIYTARFFGRTRRTLLMMSGTVFNEVLVWPVWQSTDSGHLPSGVPLGKVAQRFVGHEGVIFGIRFNLSGTVMVSVSDDRTIRVWQSDPADAYDVTSTTVIKATTTLYGHTSRVWDCQFTEEFLVSISEDATCRIWSFNKDHLDGEGGPRPLACWRGHTGKSIWSVAISPDQTTVVTGGGDCGIRLWSLQSVRYRTVDANKPLRTTALPELSTYQVAEQITAKSKGKEFIRNFCSINHGHTAIMSTHYGYLLRYDYPENRWTRLLYDSELAGYSMLQPTPCGKVVVCGTIQGNLLFVSTDAESAPVCTRLQISTEQIFDIQTSAVASTNNEVDVFVTVLGEPVHWLRLLFHSNTTWECRPVTDLTLPAATLPLCFAMDADCQILAVGSREGALLLYDIIQLKTNPCETIQSTNSLAPFLNLRRLHSKDAITSVLFIASSEQSELSSQANQEPSNLNEFTILTGGRDGAVRTLHITLPSSVSQPTQKPYHTDSMANIAPFPWTTAYADNDVPMQSIVVPFHPASTTQSAAEGKVQFIHREKVTRGWVEGLTYLDGQLLVSSFYRKRFIIFNVTHQYEQLALFCGGAHRRWYFHAVNPELWGASFVFLRRDAIHAYIAPAEDPTGEIALTPVLEQSFHGREIRALAYLPYSDNVHLPQGIVATAGEEGVLKISQQITPTFFHTLCTVHHHISVIRCIKWVIVNSDVFLFTAGGCEEMRCWKVVITTFEGEKNSPILPKVHCVEVAIAPTESVTQGVRIMDITVIPHNYSHQDTGKNNPIHATPCIYVASVHSDAALKLWACYPEQHRFVLVAEDRIYHPNCILSVDHVCLSHHSKTTAEVRNAVLVSTGSTDGFIRIFDITSVLQDWASDTPEESIDCSASVTPLAPPVCQFAAHQSGVNALRIWIDDRQSLSVWVASGGDDNQLHLARMSVACETNQKSREPIRLNIASQCAREAAHASSIQSVHVIWASAIDPYLVTVATDQRINICRITSDERNDTSSSSTSPQHTFLANEGKHKNANAITDVISSGARMGLQLHKSFTTDISDPSTSDVIPCRTGRWAMGVAGIGAQFFEFESSNEST
ncbi:WD repeat-containing protein 6 [Dispira parvispora]|uniref:WD repeat-containing protein 6 n=1 Tax=Dispira parvispora TaxID=1520584 RepID=A0A9W8E6F8_9FUNG|nr:WD repeat-containing protein 6 [Dispira parvispora]